MAHGDYHCCALCDSKMDYSHDARTKEDLCSHCTKKLVENGIMAFDGSDLVRLLDKARESGNGVGFATRLSSLGFSTCLYSNPVDEAYNKAMWPEENR